MLCQSQRSSRLCSQHDQVFREGFRADQKCLLVGHSFMEGVPCCCQVSSVIYFRHNDMQDCVIKLGKWYRTAVAEARGRLFVLFFCGSSRKQMLCNRFLHIIHSLDISFLYLKILAIRSWPSRKYRNCMLKETSISL